MYRKLTFLLLLLLSAPMAFSADGNVDVGSTGNSSSVTPTKLDLNTRLTKEERETFRLRYMKGLASIDVNDKRTRNLLVLAENKVRSVNTRELNNTRIARQARFEESEMIARKLQFINDLPATAAGK